MLRCIGWIPAAWGGHAISMPVTEIREADAYWGSVLEG